MNSIKNLIFPEVKTDLFSYLQTVRKPILIYGMGNGADKLISALEQYHVSYQDVFASDGFVRGHSYRGKIVLSYQQAVEKYGNDVIILVSFGSKLPNVLARIDELNEKHELYVPDLPVCFDELFTKDFFERNLEKFERAYELLADERSKNTFLCMIRYKLTGKIDYLKRCEATEEEECAILSFDAYRSYADMGAYNGDTIRKYVPLCKNLEKIVAFEPDQRNFKKLEQYCTENLFISHRLYHCACGKENQTISFSSSGNRNSTKDGLESHQAKTVSIEEKTIDSILTECDFIKFDVEGNEKDALLGAKRLIEKCSPDMLVSAYHKSEDLFALPLLINEFCKDYRFYLRKYPYYPGWDCNYYAIKKSQ